MINGVFRLEQFGYEALRLGPMSVCIQLVLNTGSQTY